VPCIHHHFISPFLSLLFLYIYTHTSTLFLGPLFYHLFLTTAAPISKLWKLRDSRSKLPLVATVEVCPKVRDPTKTVATASRPAAEPMAGADVDVGTELRLGLPGGGAEAAKAGKRGFEETIDLKLTLPTAGMEEDVAVKQEPPAEKAKRSAEAAAADAEKPPAPKYVHTIYLHVLLVTPSTVVISLLKDRTRAR
jgi:hypothetical protein